MTEHEVVRGERALQRVKERDSLHNQVVVGV